MCPEYELVVGNTYFRKKGINKFTWQRNDNGRLVNRVLVVVKNSVLGRLMDAHVARGAEGGVSDRFLVAAKVKEGGEKVSEERRNM